jgi:hypothetical protein
VNGQLQNAQQQVNNGFQQTQQAVTSQMPPPNQQYPQPYPQQMPPGQQAPASPTSWNPFATSATSLPPARATPPPSIPKY